MQNFKYILNFIVFSNENSFFHWNRQNQFNNYSKKQKNTEKKNVSELLLNDLSPDTICFLAESLE